MARKKRRSVRQNAWGSGPRRARSQKHKKSLKERLLTLGIWVLGLMNVVLIGSLVSDFLGSDNEQAVSMNQPRVADAHPDPASPQRGPITVEVLNGCGVPGLAHEFTEYLRAKGFDVVNVDNYEGGFDLAQSYVFDRTSLGNEHALAVAEALGVDRARVKPQLEKTRQLMVTVILGKDYPRLPAYQEMQRAKKR